MADIADQLIIIDAITRDKTVLEKDFRDILGQIRTDEAVTGKFYDEMKALAEDTDLKEVLQRRKRELIDATDPWFAMQRAEMFELDKRRERATNSLIRLLQSKDILTSAEANKLVDMTG